MPLIPNLRTYATRERSDTPRSIIGPHGAARSPRDLYWPTAVEPQRYLDTPHLVYSRWNQEAGGIDEPLGSFKQGIKPLEICLIGGGISNVVAAFELAKARENVKVTLLEATETVGGRTDSHVARDGVNVAEMGAMRFPPSEDLLYYYADAMGFTFSQCFPDPGKVPTFISYAGEGSVWHPGDHQDIPPGFDKVAKGWKNFAEHGVTKGDKPNRGQVLESPLCMQRWLKSDSPESLDRVIAAWKTYLRIFAHDSFYQGLKRIFDKESPWNIPGDEAWDDDDFQRFATLGVGSGGFGPMFPIAFNAIFRLIANGLETDQQMFARKRDDGDPTPAGIQELAAAILAKARQLRLPLEVKTETVGDLIRVNRYSINGRRTVDVEETSDGTPKIVTYDVVIVGTTTRSMNVNMNVSGTGMDREHFFSSEVRHGINNLHMTSSSKLFIRTTKFWDGQDDKFPRVILTDTKLPQLYTLDYGHPDYGMVLVTYAWEDLSTQIQAFDKPEKLFDNLRKQVRRVMSGSEYPDWAENLVPVNNCDYWLVHWQLKSLVNGAFSLGTPGQDSAISHMFFDFTKLKNPDPFVNPVLLGGDSIGFLGGWVDGALQSAMNNVSVIFKAYGDMAAKEFAPIELIQPDTYKY